MLNTLRYMIYLSIDGVCTLSGVETGRSQGGGLSTQIGVSIKFYHGFGRTRG